MKMFIFIVIGIVVVFFAWSKIQRIMWSSEAEKIYMEKFDRVKNMEYTALLDRVGKPHDEEKKVVRGHQFLVGWRVDEPGAMGAYVNDKSPQKSPSKPISEIEEIEVNGYVDFVYPIPFLKFMHTGYSMNFFKKRNGELRIIFPRQEGAGENKAAG